MVKVPRLNGVATALIPCEDLAFKLKRKHFVIEVRTCTCCLFIFVCKDAVCLPFLLHFRNCVVDNSEGGAFKDFFC